MADRISHRTTRHYRAAVLVVLAALTSSAPQAAEPPANALAGSPSYTTLSLRGRVVWLAEALKRRHGIATEPQAAETAVVLETPDGELVPIVPDVRGRAFQVDARLRDQELELFVRRYQGSPYVQVIRVFRLAPDGKYELDYWCDICAITMYILKDCECCQGPTRLRATRVGDK